MTFKTQHRSHVFGAATALILSFLTSLALSACVTEYDFTRTAPERGTFGQEVYQVLYQDARWSSRDAQARQNVLVRERNSLITALDLMVPEAILRPLDYFLRTIAPLQDSDLIPDLTRKIAGMLEEIATHTMLHERLAHQRSRRADKAFDVHGSLLEHLVAWVRLDDLSEYVARVVLSHDGVDHQGRINPNESPTLTRLTSLASEILRDVEVTEDSNRLEILLRDFCLKDDYRFGADLQTSMWVVRLDARGLPRVSRDDQGDLALPFVDLNYDGLADVNEQSQFIDVTGQPLNLDAFGAANEFGVLTRDGLGRGITEGGDFVFDYVDLNQTAANFIFDQAYDLIQRDIIFDVLDVLPELAPPRVFSLNTVGNWEVYPLQGNPLVELAYAGIELLTFDGVDEFLDVLSIVMRDHDALLAELLLSSQRLSDRIDAQPSISLTDDHTLTDDLIETLAPIMTTPGLFEDLLIALRDPVVASAALPLIDMLNYKADRAVPPPGSLYNSCFYRCERSHDSGTLDRMECVRSCPRGEIMVDFVDHAQSFGVGNRSHWERTLALFRTTSGVTYEMKVLNLDIPQADINVGVQDALPPLLRIDDVAGAFIKAVAGDLNFIDYVTDEALQNNDVDLLLNGLQNLCGSSLLDAVIQALIPTLDTVTAPDLERTCMRFEMVSRRTDLSDLELKRYRISAMIAILSLLTDVGMDETPTASQLTRFFNTPDPSLSLSLASLSLSQITDRDGYRLWENHGDMLYAAEASGLLDAVRPIFQVFSRYGLASDLARLMALLDQHYPTPEVIYFTQEGSPASRAGRGTGLVRFEEPLRDWLLSDRLFPALHQFAIVSDRIISHRGRKLDSVIADFIRHAMTYEQALTRRDGRATYRRPDERVTSFNPILLMGEALGEITRTLEAKPDAQAKWDKVSDALLDLFLEVGERESGEAYFVKSGSLALGQAVVETLGDVMRDERDASNLRTFLHDELYVSIEEMLIGRGLPLLIDLYFAATSTPQDRDLLRQIATYVLDTKGRRALLITLYDVFAELSDESLIVEVAHVLGDLINPERTWGVQSYPLPLLSHILFIVRESDARAPDSPLLDVVRNALTRAPFLRDPAGDPQGLTPLSVLGDLFADYNRLIPDDPNPLVGQDYAQISLDVAKWLRDEDRGVEQVYRLVKSRKKESDQ